MPNDPSQPLDDEAVVTDRFDIGDDAASTAAVEEFVDEQYPDEIPADDLPATGGGAPAGDVDDDADVLDGEVLDGDGDDPELAASADDLGAALDELSAERDEFKDLALRVQADFDNYRKRSAVQQAAEIDRATGQLAEALLPVLDAAEAAYVAHPDEVGPLFNLLLSELRKRGLEPIHLLDQPFDPNLADAVAHEPGDGAEARVAEVLRSGYTWKGKTLRAAMVRTTD